MTIKLKQGLNLPISGAPVQDIKPGPAIGQLGLVSADFVGMKPTLAVSVGDRVKLGQLLFADKKNEGVQYTSPGSGIVKAIHRGDKRKFVSMEIELQGDDQVEFPAINALGELSREQVQERLVESGLWVAFRTRPFSRVAAVNTEPSSLFVTAMDTNPLAPEPELIIDRNREHFVAGLQVVSKLTRGKTYVCTRPDSRVPGQDLPGVEFEQFQGPHPAGLPGTHIHYLDPVSSKKTVWHIGYQDVIAIGHLFKTGRIMVDRVVAVAGPQVNSPGLFTTRLGASLDDLIIGNVSGINNRVISGSVLSGRTSGSHTNYLGRYHTQVSVLEEGNHREFLGWQKPGFDKFSATRVYGGSWLAGKLFPLTTSTGGSKRAMVPLGLYEKVFPLRMLPTQLLRSLLVKNTDESQLLGCLELDEEDVALCTFVCPGKYDYGTVLRENLSLIEKEG
jgi:Na+-transporting NADH:ubiquinone oxidoreductase subunit A